jgi:hypothetical protein
MLLVLQLCMEPDGGSLDSSPGSPGTVVQQLQVDRSPARAAAAAAFILKSRQQLRQITRHSPVGMK